MAGSSAAWSLAGFVTRRPGEVGRILRGLLGLRLGFPIELFQWLGEQAEQSGQAKNVDLRAEPPGVAVAATVEAMRTQLRVRAHVFVERLRMNGEELRVTLRVEKLSLSLEEDSDSAVATLVKSGALNLSAPGNLLKHLPNRPAVLVHAEGNRITLDLMRHRGFQERRRLQDAIALATSFLTVHGVETDEDHVDVRLRALPGGLLHAASQVRRRVLRPGFRRVRRLLP